MERAEKTSRQVKWQDERRKRGECVICGKPCGRKPNGGRYVLCEDHLAKHRAQYRAMRDAALAYWKAKGQGKL